VHLQGIEEVVADKGYHSGAVVANLQGAEVRAYVTNSGLLRIAQRRRCFGLTTNLQTKVSDWASCRWVFKATVYKSSLWDISAPGSLVRC
jgi:hypothetical protein